MHNVDSMAFILGCNISHLLMQYLGLPLRAQYTSISIWYDALEKIEQKLASWKQIYLSKVVESHELKIHSPTCQPISASIQGTLPYEETLVGFPMGDE